MKRYLLIFLAMPAAAQQQYKLQNTHATVFLRGAELTGTVKLTLPKGESDIVVTNIAANILKESITAGADNNVTILSVTAQNNYLGEETLSPAAQRIQDSIDLLTDKTAVWKDHIIVVHEQLEILKNNRQATGVSQNMSIPTLQQLLTLSAEKTETLLADERSTQKKIKAIDDRIALLQQQLDEEKAKKDLPGGQLQIKLQADQPTATTLKINYVAPSVGWTPTYDLRVASIGAPVKLLYKANVYQNTGINWDKLALTLSTGNTSEGAQAPEVKPVGLDFMAVNSGVKVRIRGTSSLDSIDDTLPAISVDQALSGRLAGVAVSKSSSKPASISRYATVNNTGISSSFDISIPYTIPADGQQHLVAVKEFELPASYRYIAAPRYDKDVFLQAQVTGWEQMNLVPGNTNIFYEGAYVGRGNLNTQTAVDTLSFSLGRDKKIVVTREKKKDYKADKLIGGNLRREYQFEISVRNTRPTPVDIVLNDQIPISNNSDIVVEDKDPGSGTIDDATGIITWHLSLQANETKKLPFSYFVKYPKNKVVVGLE